jgi:hypothetical protein
LLAEPGLPHHPMPTHGMKRDRSAALRIKVPRQAWPRPATSAPQGSDADFFALPDEKDPGFLLTYQTALAATAPVPKFARVAAGSFEALTRSYVSSAKFKQLGPSTQAVYRRIIDDLSRKHGDKPVSMMQSIHIRRMLDAKAETPAAANHLLRTLRAPMKHAIREGIRPDDPTQGVDRLKEVGEGAETWSEEDIATYEKRWPAGTRPRLALSLLLYTPQRCRPHGPSARQGWRH